MDGLRILRVALTPEAASHIMRTAIEAGSYGIRYWATVIRVEQKDARAGMPGEQWITTMILDDMAGREDVSEKPKRFILKTSHIQKAVTAMLRDPEGTEAVNWAEQLISHEYADGPLADAVIQVACYGKVIYS